jgi:hypothetical protein
MQKYLSVSKKYKKMSQVRTVAAKLGLDSPAYISGLAGLIYVPFGYDIPLLAVFNP